MDPSQHSHPHLELARERPVNERRPPSGYPRIRPPDDAQAHAGMLGSRLRTQLDTPPTDLAGYDDRRLIKIDLNQKISPEDVAKACGGVQVVSQDDDKLVLAFATEDQLEQFEARLSRLAAGGHITHQRLLYALQDFDRWTPDDRTGLALKEHGFPTQPKFAIDAELWPLALLRDAERQRQAFEDWVSRQKGEVLDSVRQPYLTVYRIRCDLAVAKLLLRHRDVRSVDLPPRLGLARPLVFQDIQDVAIAPSPPDNAPGVVVLDTGLATGHPLLAPAVGDSQSFLDGAPAADDHGHGTFVAGIALYDDVAKLNRDGQFLPELRIFSGRVLDHENRADPGLIENKVERAVRYFVSTYGCRVFCLTYANPHQVYRGRHVSGLAVTLDALSRELGVLFVVPTGNYEGDEAGPKNWREDYPRYLTSRHAQLIDPAPALNALTVGSLARNERNERWPDDPGYRPIARAGQPSPFTRCGPSVNGAVKPELVDYGGNWMVDARAGDHVSGRTPGAGELSVSHEFATGRPFAEDSGTSFAAPRVANAAARVFAAFPKESVDLCRALLVAHARTPEQCRTLFGGDTEDLRKVTGYGCVNRSALYRSLDDYVTLWGSDAIPDRHHHFFEIPIPDDFWRGQHRVRELTVALAHRPAVRTTRVDYRASKISFKLVHAESLDEVATWFNAAIESDDLERIPERASGRGLSETVRSRGTVQASTWRFTRPSAAIRRAQWFVVVTRNDPPWGRALASEKEGYALAITLDDRTLPQLRIGTSLYAQIRARLRARARARAR